MIAEIVSATAWVLSIAILCRALMSWFPNLNPRNPLVEFVVTVTEPILAPLRAIIPRMGMMDITPIIAILLLQFIAQAVIRA